MEMSGKVRRMYLHGKLWLHEISKCTGVSRNTLRKWVMTPETEVIAAPRYRRGEVPSKLTPFHAALELALTADAHRSKQNRRTAKAPLAQVKADGYTGSYSRVADFTSAWHGQEGNAQHAFVPLSFEQGEVF